MFRTKLGLVATGAMAIFLAAGSARAGTITYSTGGSDLLVGSLTGFATIAENMNGMKVTVTYLDDSTDLAVWAGVDEVGAATGADWSLVFDGPGHTDAGTTWVLTTSSAIKSLSFDGIPGKTVFDRTGPSTSYIGTTGSNIGTDFNDDWNVVEDPGTFTGHTMGVAYLNPVGVAGAPVGDIFANVTVSFLDDLGAGASGLAAGSLEFFFDTDTIKSLTVVPEPGTMALLGLGAICIRRRKRA